MDIASVPIFFWLRPCSDKYENGFCTSIVRKHLCVEVEFQSKNNKEWPEFARGQEGVEVEGVALPCNCMYSTVYYSIFTL